MNESLLHNKNDEGDDNDILMMTSSVSPWSQNQSSNGSIEDDEKCSDVMSKTECQLTRDDLAEKLCRIMYMCGCMRYMDKSIQVNIYPIGMNVILLTRVILMGVTLIPLASSDRERLITFSWTCWSAVGWAAHLLLLYYVNLARTMWWISHVPRDQLRSFALYCRKIFWFTVTLYVCTIIPSSMAVYQGSHLSKGRMPPVWMWFGLLTNFWIFFGFSIGSAYILIMTSIPHYRLMSIKLSLIPGSARNSYGLKGTLEECTIRHSDTVSLGNYISYNFRFYFLLTSTGVLVIPLMVFLFLLVNGGVEIYDITLNITSLTMILSLLWAASSMTNAFDEFVPFFSERFAVAQKSHQDKTYVTQGGFSEWNHQKFIAFLSYINSYRGGFKFYGIRIVAAHFTQFLYILGYGGFTLIARGYIK